MRDREKEGGVKERERDRKKEKQLCVRHLLHVCVRATHNCDEAGLLGIESAVAWS